MKTVAFHLQKGGVGKTTLSGTMAYEASLNGKTLLIDCDPQGSASGWFLSKTNHELADVLTGKDTINDAIENMFPNLDILPTAGLDGGLNPYKETALTNEPLIFCNLFDELKKIGYDYIVADLSPGIGILETAVLAACDEVVTPMIPEYFALDGIQIFTNELAKLKGELKKGAIHNIIALNAFDARIKQHREIAEEVKQLPYTVITIPVDPVFRKSQAKGVAPQNFGGMKPATEEAIKKMGDLLWH